MEKLFLFTFLPNFFDFIGDYSPGKCKAAALATVQMVLMVLLFSFRRSFEIGLSCEPKVFLKTPLEFSQNLWRIFSIVVLISWTAELIGSGILSHCSAPGPTWVYNVTVVTYGVKTIPTIPYQGGWYFVRVESYGCQYILLFLRWFHSLHSKSPSL